MSLLDPKWKYVHSTATDIRKTFAKARRELEKQTRPEARSSLNLLHSSGHTVGSARQTAGMFKTFC
jgi:hypothetical protein